MTVEKPKPKQLLWPITTEADSAMNQSQFIAITCNSLKAREKSRVELLFLPHAHLVNPVSPRIIFFHSILSLNSMWPVLFSHILTIFYLLLFPQSFILIMNIKYQFAITWQAPAIWNGIPLTVRNSLTLSNF